MKHYRIGEYARYLGVTPDLLKHYEEQGLIRSKRSESGYRYYPFSTSPFLIESIRLRNYGLTLREIRDILTLHKVQTPVIEERFSRNMDLLRQEILLNQALVEDYEEFTMWREPLQTREADWSIRWSRPMYFLPHTLRDEFMDDPRIYALLKDWMSHIPIVKSAMRLSADGSITWGFLVEQSKHRRLGLPINDVVVSIPSHKVFYYQFRGPLRSMEEELSLGESHPALRTLHQMNLTPCGPLYRACVMPCDWEQGIDHQYGYYVIPLQEENKEE